jgi:hypothetical protein
MNIQRFIPFAAAMLLGGCATGYTYQSGSGDYYYGNPRVEYRYQTPSGVYGSYGPYGYYGGAYGGYYGGYSGYYGAWDPYRHSRYYVGPRYYHGPYVYGPYGGYPYGGYPYGYSTPGPQPRVIYRQPRPNHPYRPQNVIRPYVGATPRPTPPPPPPQSTPTPRSQGNAGGGRAERARIRSQGREE